MIIDQLGFKYHAYEPRVGRAILAGSLALGGRAMILGLLGDAEIAALRSEVERLRRENAMLRATLGVP